MLHALRNAVGLLKCRQLVDGQSPPAPGKQAFRSDVRERHSRQAHDPKARGLAHPSDLLISPLGDRDLEPGFARFVTKKLHFRRLASPVLELDARSPAVDVRLPHRSLQLGHVRLRHLAAGMEQRFGEIPVVRGEENAARVEVQATHRVDPPTDAGQKVAHTGSAERIVHRRHYSARLVKDHVDERLSNDALAIDFDRVRFGVNLGPELRHDLAVDPHPPACDERFCCAPGRNSGTGQDLLQAQHGHPRRDTLKTLSMRRVNKPWGYEIIWAETERYVGKILHIAAGQKLSRQYHVKKDETFLVQAGRMDLELGEGTDRKVVHMGVQDAFHCRPGTIHRMVAVTDVDVIEVSTPELDDVVRLEDAYGREGTSDA